MPSITRRPSFLVRSSLLTLALCAAPLVAAAPFDTTSATGVAFWGPVVEGWNWWLEKVWSPSSYVLDPNGVPAQEIQSPEPPPAPTANPDGRSA